MRYLVGNWKMQLDEQESEQLARDIVRLWAGRAAGAPADGVTMVVCPSHLAIEEVGKITRGTAVALGAQDAFWEEKGAYTGEVSPKTLRQLGCEYCIIGHSERRQHLGETDEMVNRKTLAALTAGITPIVCVGETMAERHEGKREAVVIGQVRAALRGVSPLGTQKVLVAYEPRWVIGTGKAVSPDDAAEMHHLILNALYESYPAEQVERCFAVIYGGAVEPKNLAGFLAMPVISGALVGGASLKPESFVALAEIAAEAPR